jgi:hypothetical protein
MQTIWSALITGAFAVFAACVPLIRWTALRDSPRLKLRVIGGIVFGLVAGVAMVLFLLFGFAKSPKVTITAPSGSLAAPAEVGPNTSIEGHASDLTHDQLFLVLRSTELQYYPQAQVLDWNGDNWRATLKALPGAGLYDLLAVAATTPEARAELQTYIQVCQTITCEGVATLWDGIAAQVTVPVMIP